MDKNTIKQYIEEIKLAIMEEHITNALQKIVVILEELENRIH